MTITQKCIIFFLSICKPYHTNQQIRPNFHLLYVILLFVTWSEQCTWKYTQTDSQQWCDCKVGYTGRSVFAPLTPTEFCSRYVALIVTNRSFQSVSTRNNAAVGSSSLPTYIASGGPNGYGHVLFNSNFAQYLDAGSHCFNPDFTTSQKGFTLLTVV